MSTLYESLKGAIKVLISHTHARARAHY